ncbi:MAG: hypothetical protein D4R82_04005 [Dehalococcoidia bacterium]|nr:MAG: hypothetical protein D4R82_04005 [Dehalococcoidia bacterium]
MRRAGLRKWDTMTVFRRVFADKAIDGPLLNSMVKAVGEVVEENNKMLLEELYGDSEREASKL